MRTPAEGFFDSLRSLPYSIPLRGEKVYLFLSVCAEICCSGGTLWVGHPMPTAQVAQKFGVFCRWKPVILPLDRRGRGAYNGDKFIFSNAMKERVSRLPPHREPPLAERGQARRRENMAPERRAQAIAPGYDGSARYSGGRCWTPGEALASVGVKRSGTTGIPLVFC